MNEEYHYIVVEQDGSMTYGGLNAYQTERSYDPPHETIEEMEKFCLLLEARLI